MPENAQEHLKRTLFLRDMDPAMAQQFADALTGYEVLLRIVSRSGVTLRTDDMEEARQNGTRYTGASQELALGRLDARLRAARSERTRI